MHYLIYRKRIFRASFKNKCKCLASKDPEMDLCLIETLRLLNEPYRSQSNAINTWFRKVLIAMHISRDLTVSATSLRTTHLHSFG